MESMKMDSSGAEQRKGFNPRDFVKTNKKPVTVSLAVIGVLACVSTVLSVHLSSESNKPKFEAQFWPETEENYEDIPGSRGKRNPQFSRNNFKTRFNLQEILDNNYSSETWNGTWVSDSQYVYRDVDESLVMVDAAGGPGRVIVPGRVMRSPRVFRFKLSPDQKYVMLAFRPQRLFRHSFLAQYDLYNIATGQRTKLQPDLDALIKQLGGPAPPPLPRGQSPPQLPVEFAMWGPRGASIAYVFGANIYYRETPEA